jgi:RimJ/RimL family protein N-acetyltransferase
VDPEALASFEQTVALPGGERVRLRPIRPDDAPRLAELYDRLSRHTVYQRFFTVMRRLPPDWARFLANVDYRRRFALVAEDAAAPTPTLVGVARYEPSPDGDAAELAFVVQDSWQGKGLGTLLVRELLRAAELNGIERFRAYVLGDNRRMLHLLARHTDVRERRIDQGVVELELTRKRR